MTTEMHTFRKTITFPGGSVQVSLREDSLNIFLIEGPWPATAELMLVPEHFLDSGTLKAYPKISGRVFYFNRLYVSPRIRHRGHATRILTELVKVADDCKINVYIDINPYGDLDLSQLIALYSKFDFVKVSEHSMVRPFRQGTEVAAVGSAFTPNTQIQTEEEEDVQL